MLSDIPTLHMQSCCTALHCQRELTVAILACTSHHITHHHIITSPHHHITLHHTTSHYITHPHMTLRPSSHCTSNITHHTLGLLVSQRFTKRRDHMAQGTKSRPYHITWHHIASVMLVNGPFADERNVRENRRGRERKIE